MNKMHKAIILLVVIVLFISPVMAGYYIPKVTPRQTAIAEKTGNYTITTTDYIVYVNASGVMNITLPNATNDNNIYSIKRIDSNTVNGWVSVNTSFNQTIDGVKWYNLSNPMDAVTVKSNNSNWTIIAKLVNVNYLPLTGGTLTGTLLGTTIGATYFANAAGTNMLAASTGSTSYVAINPATGVIYPIQYSTSRPAYTQGGLIYNTTTNGIEWTGDNNAWTTTNRLRNITYSAADNLTGRVANTVYQNNNTLTYISISFAQDGGACSHVLKVDTVNPPLKVFARTNTSTGAVATPLLTAIIPAMHYYTYIPAGSCPSISLWREIE